MSQLTHVHFCSKLKFIERVRNCPDIAIKNSLFGLHLFFISVYLFCLFVILFLPDCNQMSQEFPVTKFTICVQILKWQSVSQWPRVSVELPGQKNPATNLEGITFTKPRQGSGGRSVRELEVGWLVTNGLGLKTTLPDDHHHLNLFSYLYLYLCLYLYL